MKRWILSLALLAALLALAACAAQEPAKPAAPAPAAPAPEAILPRKDAWEQEWERTLAAAKREGKVVLAVPLGPGIRKAVTEPFEKRFGITVEVTQFSGPEFPTRIRPEREAGQYLWDVKISGSTTIFNALKPIGAVDPLEPALILPEVKEPKNWRQGRFPFLDKDRQIVAFSLYTTGFWFINPSLVKPEEFKSWKDLLDPKWKGKIMIHDPRLAGPGQSRFQFFYLHPQLGIDFIQALAPQLVLSRDYDQQLTWLATGRYPLVIGSHEDLAEQKMKEGLPIAKLNPQQLREGGYLASGTGNLSLINKAAHPNAAKVFLNWFLSKEGQTEYSRGSFLPSWRVDVPTDHIAKEKLPGEGFLNLATEEAHLARERVGEIARELFGR